MPENSIMRDLVDRLAFAIQDEGITRMQARRYAKAALEALQDGDQIGPLKICQMDAGHSSRGVVAVAADADDAVLVADVQPQRLPANDQPIADLSSIADGRITP